MDDMARRLYSAEQVRELDARVQGEGGVPGYTLMQRAARAAWEVLADRWPQARRVLVLCGPGNNGGDGYEMAGLARTAGTAVQVLQVGGLPVSGDAVTALSSWQRIGGEVQPCNDEALSGVGVGDVLVDALFGIGLARPLHGPAAEAVTAINSAHARGAGVLAVDVPSGLDATTGAAPELAVQADITVTFIGQKLGLHTGAGPDYAGEVCYASLDISPTVFVCTPPLASLLHASQLRAVPPRRRSAHKGSHGHVLLIGGDTGTVGAILLAARASLRAGAGLVSVCTRVAHAVALTAAQPELMVRGADSADQLAAHLQAATVIGLGPGLGQQDWGAGIFRALLANARVPLVLDADALNLLAAAPRKLPDAVLTPHPGEAARLLGISTAEVQRDRLAAIRALREKFGAVVVLKGAGTLVQGESTWLCPYGNPGMGVAGMGDVLTGVICALLAQGLKPEAAACNGVLVHALAGDAAARAGQRGLLPSDLIEALRGVLNP